MAAVLGRARGKFYWERLEKQAQRLGELEQCVRERDIRLAEMEQCVRERDIRLAEMEQRLEKANNEARFLNDMLSAAASLLGKYKQSSTTNNKQQQ